MHALNVALAVTALVVVALGLLSNRIKRSVLSVPLIALAVGVAVGPQALGLLDPAGWRHGHTLLEQAARITLAIGLMGIALRTPAEDFRRLLRPVGLLLLLGMLGMWLASAGLAYALLGVAPLVALLIGAIVTPTDPIVASSIVTGSFAQEKLPDRVRSTLSLESGANDGLAYLLVMLPIVLLHHAPSVEGAALGPALWRWFVDALAVGVLLAVVIGAALGALAGWALRRAEAAALVGEHSFLSFSVALSLLALAAAKLAGSDGILAVFVTGAVLNLTIDRREKQDEENVQEAIGKLFNLPIFVLIGIFLPWREWAELGWTALALAGLVLLLRRPVPVLLLAPFLRRPLVRADVAFLGWFGPVGVAALYYAMLATRETGETILWPVASLVIAASIVAHGVTAAPLTRLYAARAGGGRPGERRRRGGEEAAPA